MIRDPRALGALARAQLALLSAQLEVWRQPVGQLVTPTAGAAASPDGVAGRGPSDVPPEARRLSRAVARAARYGVFRPRCLARSIALHRLLERAGITDSHVRIGVRRVDGAFSAHAWVELHGVPLGEPRRVRRDYTPLGAMRFG